MHVIIIIIILISVENSAPDESDDSQSRAWYRTGRYTRIHPHFSFNRNIFKHGYSATTIQGVYQPILCPPVAVQNSVFAN